MKKSSFFERFSMVQCNKILTQKRRNLLQLRLLMLNFISCPIFQRIIFYSYQSLLLNLQYIIMTNNLQLFRHVIKQFLPSEQIQSKQQFLSLIEHLCDMKLLSPSQLSKLTHKIKSQQEISYPYSFKQFEQFIMINFADKNSQKMLEELKSIRLKLRQTKGVLAIWKDKGLTNKERLELESLFQRGNARVQEFYQRLVEEKEALEKISEQELQMISSLEEWTKMQKLQQPFPGYKQYQSHHQKLIQQLFTKIRVREVHFKQRKVSLKSNKAQTLPGFDSRNDEPVEVTLIPKRSLEFDLMNEQLTTFNARKQLMLSPYFARFLGYNSHSDQHFYQYFCELAIGNNLGDFITKSRVQLQEDTPLFKYWAYLLYHCFYDIFLMCSYYARLPILLSDFQICNNGLRLVLKKIRFIEPRDQSENLNYQAQLLENLAQVVLGLLKTDIQSWSVQTKFKKIQNRSLLSCLINAKQGHLNFREGRVDKKVDFFNLQTHPLFESFNLIEGQTIIENFESILTTK